MGRKIKKEDVLDWLGSNYTIEDLAEILAQVLNGDRNVDLLRRDIEDYTEYHSYYWIGW